LRIAVLGYGAVVEGTALFDGEDLLRLGKRAMRDIRGQQIGMVFQDPMTSLHPMMTTGLQLTEHIRFHQRAGAAAARTMAVELLHEVRIPDAAGALNAYPHQFSGGMRQRIAIAIALACGPRILIADEPTTALDVTVQAGILRLLDRLRRQSRLSVILITHDLGVMSSIADELMVMYAGRVAESGPTASVLGAPRHPYTAGLLAALPHPEAREDTPLVSIRGAPPSPQGRPDGCPFHPRCAYALPSCATDVPPLSAIEGRGRRLACPPDPFAANSPSGQAGFAPGPTPPASGGVR